MRPIALLLLLSACGGRDPVHGADIDATCIPPTDSMCSPERDEVGAREGCENTYDCCLASGCGANHNDCDCCSFADAPEDCA